MSKLDLLALDRAEHVIARVCRLKQICVQGLDVEWDISEHGELYY
jgi:hypothetical protein